MKRLFVLCAVVICSAASDARAQILGDIAKAEEARRATIKQPAKVYTEKDLVSPRGLPPVTEPARVSGMSPAPVTAASTPVAITNVSIKDESYWKDRMRVLRNQLDADETFEREAATRERAFNEQVQRNSADLYNADRRQLAATSRAWQDAVAELGRLRASIVNDRRAITSLEEEARRAGVLPGWLLP